MAGIAQAQRLGLGLAEEHPEVAAQYQEGATCLELAHSYLPDHVEVSRSVAMTAVRYALQQLIPSDELSLLAKAHWRENGITAGNSTLQNGTGIHAQSLEEQMAAAKSGYQYGLGRCSKTVLAYGRLRGQLAQGKIPFSDKERSALVELVNDLSYQHPPGSKGAGKPAYGRIQAELLQRFGVPRTTSALRVAYYRSTKDTDSRR